MIQICPRISLTLTAFAKNSVFVLRLIDVRWREKGAIRSVNYTMYYSGCERSARQLATIVHKGLVRSFIKKIQCNGRIIAINLLKPTGYVMHQTV